MQATSSKRPSAERNSLIASHIEIAKRISLKMARRCPDWVSRDDLVAAGLLGLTEAADRYDDTRQEPFLVFAEKRIRGAVLDELRRGDIMPRRVRQTARKIGRTMQELERTYARPPTDEEVAAALGVSIDEYRADLEQLVHVTIGVFEAKDDVGSTDAAPDVLADRAHAMAKVRSALYRLERRDAIVLSLYYNDELTYAEIGKVLGVTTSRVCQLHSRAIARLKTEIEGANGSSEVD